MFFRIVFHDEEQSLDTDTSDHAFWLATAWFWGSNGPPKVVISLNTSFKNQDSKQSATETSRKPPFGGFWIASSHPSDAHEGLHSHQLDWISAFSKLLDDWSSHHGTPKGPTDCFCFDFCKFGFLFSLNLPQFYLTSCHLQCRSEQSQSCTSFTLAGLFSKFDHEVFMCCLTQNHGVHPQPRHL